MLRVDCGVEFEQVTGFDEPFAPLLVRGPRRGLGRLELRPAQAREHQLAGEHGVPGTREEHGAGLADERGTSVDRG
jgi:hypothetical protein